MNFVEALKLVQQGKSISRSSWPELVITNKGNFMVFALLYQRGEGKYVGMHASLDLDSMLADDWREE